MIQGWVHDRVSNNDAIDALPTSRDKLMAPPRETYTPNGNAPYWPTKETASGAAPATAPAGDSSIPPELQSIQSLGQMAPSEKKDISDKNINPWVHWYTYDNVNPVNMPRTDNSPPHDSHQTNSNLEYWPSAMAQEDLKTHSYLQTDAQFKGPPAELGGVPAELGGGGAPPAELGGGAAAPAKIWKPIGTWNSWDGTYHHGDDRYFPGGDNVNGVNYWLNQRKEVPAELGGGGGAPPAELGGGAPPAELGGAGAPAKIWKPIGTWNSWDGTYHHGDDRYFPGGDNVNGVNYWLN
jgi:hypothetical protein